MRKEAAYPSIQFAATHFTAAHRFLGCGVKEYAEFTENHHSGQRFYSSGTSAASPEFGQVKVKTAVWSRK